jgi:hypothetical protein
MTVISRDISQLEKVERLNLINSCTGYKSANLLQQNQKMEQSLLYLAVLRI